MSFEFVNFLFCLFIRVVINGYGWIGCNMLCVLYQGCEYGSNWDVQLVVINDLGLAEFFLYLICYDIMYGCFNMVVILLDDNILQVNGDCVCLLWIEDLAQCLWVELNVDLVLECIGIFCVYVDVGFYLQVGVKCVIIGVVVFDDVDCMFVYGVNYQQLNVEYKVVFSVFCIIYCIVLLLQIMDVSFGVKQVFMIEIYFYISDQVLLDYVYWDLCRGRVGV